MRRLRPGPSSLGRGLPAPHHGLLLLDPGVARPGLRGGESASGGWDAKGRRPPSLTAELGSCLPGPPARPRTRPGRRPLRRSPGPLPGRAKQLPACVRASSAGGPYPAISAPHRFAALPSSTPL